jgi:DNA-binding NtrC family response regulator
METERKKILIIDDEARIREIYIQTFVEAGMIVRWASDAREATNILIREKIDVVLLDLRMPGVDGKEMFEVIQEYDPCMKVIVASVFPLEKQKAMVPSAHEYHDKSHGATMLLEKVLQMA